MKSPRIFACLALLIAVCSLPASASAFWPMYGSGIGGGGWGGAGFYGPWHGTLHTAAYSPPPPYFSIHPPVYYSPNIVRRSYGWSPYAYGPYAPPRIVVSEPTVAPQPLLVINPYVNDAAELPAPKAE